MRLRDVLPFSDLPAAAPASLTATNTALLYRQSMSAFAAVFVNTVLFVLVMWPIAARGPLLAWFATMLILMTLRSLLVWRYMRVRPPVADAPRWARWFVISAALAGALWGTGALLFFPADHPVYQVFIIFLLAGTAAGATSTLSPVPLAYPLFLLPMMLPLAIRLLTMGDSRYALMGAVALFFTIMMMKVSRQIRAAIVAHHRLMLREQSRGRSMELLAKGAPLASVLDEIVRGIEEQEPGMLCSILLVDRPGRRLLLGTAPSLPDFYNAAIHGIEIAHGAGCCGTAAALGQRMIAEDVQTHPLWERHRAIAARAGLRSCWSEPIFGPGRTVIGTFAIYHRVPCVPTNDQLKLIESAAYLVGLAIERSGVEDELQLAALVYRNCSEAMVVVDAAERIVAINPACTALTGYGSDDVVGRHARVFRPVKDVHYRDFLRGLKGAGSWQGEVWIRRKNGESCAVWLAVRSIIGDDGRVHRRVALMSDITERKRADEMIWKQANYDQLTGLPNRRLFRDRLGQEIKKAHRSGRGMALLFLDLDRFKEINDTLGHDAGDALLAQAAQRIAACVRESDTVARLGGDEFTVVLSEIDDAVGAERIAQEIIQRFSRPFALSGQMLYVTTSIGITVYPGDATDVESLVKNADQAMYVAKSAGRNRFSYFTGSLQQAAHKRLSMIAELRNALGAGQFSIHYQPIVDLASGAVMKAEALVRWHHPKLGPVSPGEFIPVAEETGLINDIGDWVFREAASMAKRCIDLSGGAFQVSVNVSPAQFHNTTSYGDWLEYLAGLGLTGRNVVVEITEGLLLHADPRVFERLMQFSNAGMEVAIDDFGTGYSSLAYLKRFDIDYLKIDQSFVRDLASDPNDRALAESIVVMAHKLGLKVVAEGVETVEQRDILIAAGCDFAQGYLYSRPLPTEEFELFLARTRADPMLRQVPPLSAQA